MKLGTMDFPLWISLLLLVFIIFPLKSESPEDPNFEDESDNDSTTKSPEDPNDDDNENETDNDSTTKSPEDPNDDDKEDKTDNDSTTKSPEDPNDDDNENETDNDSTTKSPEDLNDDDNEDESDNGSLTTSVIAVNETAPTTGNSTNGVVVMSTMTTVQAKPDGMEMAQSGQDGVKDGQRETDIAVKVGVPVALLGLVSLLGIIRLVSSGQLKNRVPGLGRIFGKIPEKSVSVYAANGPSSGNGTSETFVNRTYAMQSGYDNKQPEGKPPAGSDHDNMEQGIYLYDNPEVLSDDSDTTYQTLDDGRLDPSYIDLARSNRQPPAMPQRKYGETAHENAFV